MVLLQVRGAQSNPPSQPSLSTSPVGRLQKPVGAGCGSRWEWEQREGEDGNKLLLKKAPRNTATPTRFSTRRACCCGAGEERCKIIQKQALPLRSLRVHYNQRKERAAGRYRPSHHHPAASYAGTDGLHKAARATGCHGGRGRHHVRAGERVDQAQLPLQKTPKTAKTRVDLPQPSRLIDSSTPRLEKNKGVGVPVVRHVGGGKPGASADSTGPFLQKKKADGWTVPAPDTHPRRCPSSKPEQLSRCGAAEVCSVYQDQGRQGHTKKPHARHR